MIKMEIKDYNYLGDIEGLDIKDPEDLNLFKYIGNIHKDLENDIIYDQINFSEFTNQTQDFNSEGFSILTGPITRSGAFPYERGGYKITLYKQWDNIKDVFDGLEYIPLIGSKSVGSHNAEMIGFAYNFKPDDEKEQMFADIITLRDIAELSDNYTPENEGWEVSIGFKDHRVGDKQIIDYIDHLAMSLRNEETGRCRMGGDPCYAAPVIHDQNLTEVVN